MIKGKSHWLPLLIASLLGAIGLGGLTCVLCSTAGIALVSLFGLTAVLFVMTNNQIFLATAALFFLITITLYLENRNTCQLKPLGKK